jgi:hypothetical protein
VFEGLQATAEALVRTLSDDINKFAPDIAKVRLATASSLADLAFNFGYRLAEGGAEMEETEQGSGMQSVLMFETLHLIDRDYFQRFGWKQAAIWAIEEPESSLNTALEARRIAPACVSDLRLIKVAGVATKRFDANEPQQI